MNLSFTACSFFLKKFNERKISNNIYDLNKNIIIHKDEDIVFENALSLFDEFFQKNNGFNDDKNNSRAFTCDYIGDKVENDNYVLYSARIGSGYYGDSSDIININTKNLVHKKTKEEVELKYFYVLIVIPKDNPDLVVNKGILIFQNIGRFGIKTMLCEEMDKYFKLNYNVVLRCYNIAPSLFIDSLLAGNMLKGLTLIRHNKSADSSDNYYYGCRTEERRFFNIDFKEKGLHQLVKKFKRFIDNPHEKFIGDDNEKYDEVKIEIKTGEKNRKISLSNLDNVSIIESLPPGIKNDSGNADLTKLVNYLKDRIDIYLDNMCLREE